MSGLGASQASNGSSVMKAGDELTISPGLMLAMTLKGLVLPEADGLAERALSPAEVLLLEEAAEGRASIATWQSHGGFLDELKARGLLGAVAAPSSEASVGGPVEAKRFRDGDQLVLATPVIFRLGRSGFEQLDHDGRVRVRLSGAELLATTEFRRPTSAAQAWVNHRNVAGVSALDESSFRALVRRLVDSEVLGAFDSGDTLRQRSLSREEREIRRAILRQREIGAAVDDGLAQHVAAERKRVARTGITRTPVVPVHFQWQIPPLALGMIVAHAEASEGGRLREHYDFHPAWLSDTNRIPPAGKGTAIYLFSHYIWSSAQNLEYSAKVKAADPHCITIHGGPNVPKYEADQAAYFRAHPHVDVAVQGEGEVTTAEALAALSTVVGSGRPDLSVLEGVAGLAFRLGDRIVRTQDRGRILDLDALPSPYLTGLFDSYGAASPETAVLETNRGCPYGCTFCDWGSATLSRVRRFSLERVFEELEWCARHGVRVIGLADANFGILERDVAIAEKVAELKGRYGFPHHLGLNYAKNSLTHLKKIVNVLVDAGILTYGQLSLQSMDPDTLSTIKRSNIKVEKYHELAHEFRRAGLPLFVDLMMGLPGASVQSFRNDLQQSIDREVIAKIHPTQLLVNSPMNEPEYRRRHGIEVAPGELVTSAASFTRHEYGDMQRLRRIFLLLEKFGVLRHVARYVRQETGIGEMDFYERLATAARAQRQRWPVLAFTLEAIPTLMVPPGCWRLFLDDVRRYLVEVLEIRDDAALATVLAVQLALLPARDRRFPETVQLAHDYAAWHAAMIAAKDQGRFDDWTELVPPLRQFGPATFTVSDPHEVCAFGMGHTVESDIYGVWELASPVSRPVTPFHAALN
jgi:radical SAM superfamily enzyme YgiQ (UPF0313 family)